MRLARQHAIKLKPTFTDDVKVCLRVSELAGKPFTVDELTGLESGELAMHPMMVEIALAYGIQPKWLIAAHGPMLEGDPEPEVKPSALTDDHKQLLRGFDFGSLELKQAMLEIALLSETTGSGRYDRYVIDKFIENEMRRGYDIREFLQGPPNVTKTA